MSVSCREREGGSTASGWELPAGLELTPRFDRPPESPGLLAEPELARWPALAARNRRLLLRGRVRVAGVDLARAREHLRAELPGVLSPLGPEDPLVFVTGHQPVFYHPGVWVKLFAGARAAAASRGRLLNLVVDSDTADLSVPVPLLSRCPDRVPTPAIRRIEPEGTGSAEIPLEHRPAPSPAAWQAFVARVAEGLATLAPEAARRLEALAALGPLPGESVAAFFSRVRRSWEGSGPVPGPDDYLELPVSVVSRTLAFRLWVLEWAGRAGLWRQAYNEALRQYRRLHRLRYAANPFPDLEATPWGVEIPFWALSRVDERWVREPVLAEAAGDGPRGDDDPAPWPERIVLRSAGAGGGRVLVEVPARDPLEGARALAAAGIELRPKAIPLTLFARLFLGDLFIHGTGGARYESVGDFLLAARWPHGFHREVPGYAVCSATLHLEIRGGTGRPGRRERLEGFLRRLEHNPQQIVAELRDELGPEAARAGVTPDPELESLAARKEELIREIQAGGDRKALGEAIRAVNGELSRRLAPLAEYLRREVEVARAEEAVRTERGFPFFLFAPDELWRLLVPEPGGAESPAGG